MIGISCNPEPMQEDRKFPSNGYYSPLLGILGATLCHSISPTLEIGIRPEASQQVLRTLYQQRSKPPITSFRDSELLVDVAGLVAARSQPEVGTNVSGVFKPIRITDCQDVLKRSDWTHTTNLTKASSLGIFVSGDVLLYRMCRSLCSGVKWFPAKASNWVSTHQVHGLRLLLRMWCRMQMGA
jgi:hypothetical protein